MQALHRFSTVWFQPGLPLQASYITGHKSGQDCAASKSSNPTWATCLSFTVEGCAVIVTPPHPVKSPPFSPADVNSRAVGTPRGPNQR